MSNLYFLVGLPGSGKTTYANSISNVEVFSSDLIRKELFKNEEDQSNNKLVFNTLHERIKLSLEQKKDVVYDATNVTEKNRIKFLKEIKNIDCNKICILILTDYDICLKNNNSRERKVPEEVIKNMYLKFDIPQYREGWDEIKIISKFDFDKSYDITDTMETLRRIPHDNPYHQKTIGNHICAVTNDIVKSCEKVLPLEELWRLQEVAFYHDIGKSFTKTFQNSKGEITDIAHYYGHENVSAYMYLLYKLYDEFCNDKILSIKELLYRADLIGLHMRPFNINGEKSLNKLKDKIGEDKVMELLIINSSDSKF